MARSEPEEPACRESGFAYLWVLLSIALIGLALSVGADIYATTLQREKERELIAIGRQFRAAIASYRAVPMPGRPSAIGGQYPTSLDDLLEDKRTLGVRRHLRKIFVDPMTGKPEWGLVRLGDRVLGVHSLSERTPIQQANFEVEDATLSGSKKLSEWWFTDPPDLRFRINASGEPVVLESAPRPPESAASTARPAPGKGKP